MPAVQSTVVILSRTKMSANRVCVGAYDLRNRRMLRLLDNTASALTDQCQYQVGETYEITYEPRYMIFPPHTEDVAVYGFNQIPTIFGFDIETLTSQLSFNLSGLNDLFDGKLIWSHDSGYISEADNVTYSVTIASLGCDLVKEGDYYVYRQWGMLMNKVKYVGCLGIDEMPQTISAGTKIRFSLARMWDMNGDGNRRSYLQLSGIY